jgi:hypothetical protein
MFPGLLGADNGRKHAAQNNFDFLIRTAVSHQAAEQASAAVQG